MHSAQEGKDCMKSHFVLKRSIFEAHVLLKENTGFFSFSSRLLVTLDPVERMLPNVWRWDTNP